MDFMNSAALEYITKRLNEGAAYREPLMKDGRVTGYYIKEFLDQNPDIRKREKNEKDQVLQFVDEQGVLELAKKSGDPKAFLDAIGMLDDEEKGN